MGAYFVLGAAGSGLQDDGPHKLTTQKTVLGDYSRVTKDGADLVNGSATGKDLEASGVKNGKSVAGIYSTADLSGYNPDDPSTAPSPAELAAAEGLTVLGGYGETADPEAVLDKFFAALKAQSQEGSSSGSGTTSELVGSPEEADLDGAVMKCRAAKGKNALTKQQQTNSFCAWADNSTIAMVSPGDATKGVTKDVAVGLTTKLRKEVRVPA